MQAANQWTGAPIATGDLQLTLVYLCGDAPPDADNIVKPIQDALAGLVYSDDSLITDVESHRRSLSGVFDLTQLPQLVTDGIFNGEECVYVRVSRSRQLEEYL